MQVLVNTNSSVAGSDELADEVEATITEVLSHHAAQITRVEVHLSDLNAGKGGQDCSCRIEARIGGQQPVAVSHEATTIEQAYTGAAAKLEKLVGSRLGRLHTRKGNTSMGGAESP